jgi:hypothetical protein
VPTPRIDAHTHVFAPEVVKQRDRLFARDPYFRQLYEQPRSRLATAEELLAELERSGFDAAVACGWGWTDHALCVEQNDYLIDAVRRYPDRLIGFAAIQPTAGEAAVREVERALRQYPMPRDEDARDRWRAREQQLRRLVDLEKLILNDLPSTSSGVSLLSPEQQLEVSDFVDQAIDLSRRRVLLIRALLANPPAQVEAEVRDLLQRRQYASGRVAEEMDELLQLKREQDERGRRWLEDLHVTELNLDQVETFLRALAYDQAVTPANVSQRIQRLKTRVQARKESVEELERHINAAMG